MVGLDLLAGHELGEEAVLVGELLEVAWLDDASGLEDEDAIAVGNGAEAVSDRVS